jgi:hypothetical protein
VLVYNDSSGGGFFSPGGAGPGYNSQIAQYLGQQSQAQQPTTQPVGVIVGVSDGKSLADKISTVASEAQAIVKGNIINLEKDLAAALSRPSSDGA